MTEQKEMWKNIYFLIHGLWKEHATEKDARWSLLVDNIDKLLDGYAPFSSSHKEIKNHSAFILLLEIGPVIMPWLLRQYSIKNSWWYPIALSHIIKQKVIKPEHAGIYNAIREDWLNWGKEKGYLK